VPNVNAFICPGTRNNVRTNTILDASTGQRILQDLLNNALGGAAGSNGHSYELLGAIHGESNKITQALCRTYALQYNMAMKGFIPGPSGFWHLHDSDDADANEKWDKPDNHGDAGGNVAYCDGHCAWVTSRRHDYEWRITRDIN
jgi:prepilin-type processing-associated H-X9-DG protein